MGVVRAAAADPSAPDAGRRRIDEFVPRAVLLHLLAVLGIVLLPHLQRLPLWETLILLAIIAWRTLAILRQWRPVSRWLRVVLTLAAFGTVFAAFGNIAGQTAGTALLAVMACLKLTELDSRRDLMVMVLLLYFLLITHFLFSQEIWTAFYLLGCAALITAVLVEANHPEGALPLRVSLRTGGRLMLPALPLMLLLFVLFPRIPGPLWGLPNDAGAARTGLSDDMTPGNIQNLIDSDEVAFRVRFTGPVPPLEKMYWRGPVLAEFDGTTWKAGVRPGTTAPPLLADGPLYSYEMVLEPQRRRWLLALDLPDGTTLPPDALLTPDYQLVARDDVRERRMYRLSSHGRYLLQPDLPQNWRRVFLQLPRGYDPRTRALAQRWREQGLDDLGVVNAALAMFRGKEFYYTRVPPRLGRDSVDEFLFDTHRGFCEHYSGSFTVLMRAAGIPARVVAGYQGGVKNELGEYYVVQQSDAHAWSEVWLPGQGWVRIDPTAAVAPERVEKGIAAALAGTGTLPAFLDPNRRAFILMAGLKARWDWANEQWNRWVLGYGPDLQAQILGRLGLVDWSDMILALTVGVSLVLGLLGLGLARQLLPRREPDAVLEQWLKAGRRLRRAGLEQRPDEGPLDFSGRVVRERPDLAPLMERICGLYLRLRYLRAPEPAQLRELSQAVAALRA